MRPHDELQPTADGALLHWLFGKAIPVSVQHWLRDRGWFGTLSDVLTLIVPALQPRLIPRFITAHQEASCLGRSYGSLPHQHLDLFGVTAADPARPVMVFVHGGAWGSGKALFYRILGKRCVPSLRIVASSFPRSSLTFYAFPVLPISASRAPSYTIALSLKVRPRSRQGMCT